MLTRVLSGSLDGSARTAMVITVSQARQHGGETFWSLGFGDKLSVVRVNLRRPKAKKRAPLLAEATTFMWGNLAHADTLRGSQRPQKPNRFVGIRTALAHKYKYLVQVLQAFQAGGGASDSEGGGSGGGGGGGSGSGNGGGSGMGARRA